MEQTERSRIRQHAERAVTDEAGEILAQGHVAHLGFSDGGQPYVIPLAYHYDPARPGKLYLHGGHSSRAGQIAASGQPVCVTVTMLDGLVYSRNALYHSMNYRSVVCFGRGRTVEDNAEKNAIFEDMVRRYFPGRTAGTDYEAATAAHLTGTALVEIEIEEMSAKARRGGPRGPLDDGEDSPFTRGVVPL